MKLVVEDPWEALRRHTPARIALGRAGPALPTKAVLEFGLAHARARDAVHHALDAELLERELRTAGYAPVRVHSRAPDRAVYLARPDLGRRLDDESRARLGDENRARLGGAAEIVVAIADGLSAIAVQSHAVPVLAELVRLAPARWSRVAAVIALQGRVALGDEIGALLNARLAVVMIGERPGLSAPDSLGIYITCAPRVGRTDAERNCISNIRPQGLAYAQAASKLDWLAGAALARGVTGIALKDEESTSHDRGDNLMPLKEY